MTESCVINILRMLGSVLFTYFFCVSYPIPTCMLEMSIKYIHRCSAAKLYCVFCSSCLREVLISSLTSLSYFPSCLPLTIKCAFTFYKGAY